MRCSTHLCTRRKHLTVYTVYKKKPVVFLSAHVGVYLEQHAFKKGVNFIAVPLQKVSLCLKQKMTLRHKEINKASDRNTTLTSSMSQPKGQTQTGN